MIRRVGHSIRATCQDREIGHLDFDADGFVADVEVRADHRRQGVATAMLRLLEDEGFTPSFAPAGCGNTTDGDAWIAAMQRA